MSYGAKLGQMIGRYFEAMSPFAGKHSLARMGLSGINDAAGFQASKDYFGNLMPRLRALKGQMSIGEMVRGYFKGLTAEDILWSGADDAMKQELTSAGIAPLTQQAIKSNQMARLSTAIGAGVLGLNSMFGRDEGLVGGTLNFGVRAGMHAGIGAGMRYLGHPTLGAGYWAWSGINMLRGGDNFGPF